MTTVDAQHEPPRVADPVAELADQVAGHVHDGPAARTVLGLVRTYQWARAGRPSPCRFYPSCSAYAVEAVERRGALKGSWLAARRLSRCRPWGGSGFDPVPD